MESLYRKYRPLTFESVVGQQHIVSTLEHAVAEGRLSHAYLFCGPRGTGKTTMARILAKALLCQKAAAAREQGASGCMPDGTCPECEQIAEGTHPDVYELDAASRTGVDNVREEIIGSVNFAPVRGAYKVYIIDEVHMLTVAAFNALLKTLEEPPSHVVFVMCTTDPQKIPETILSRCQRFDFHRISNEDIVGRLSYICEQEGFAYDVEALEVVAKHARGGMRDALSTLEQLSVFGNGSVTIDDARSLLGEVAGSVLAEFARAIAARDVAALFALVREQVDEGGDLMELTRDLIAHLRDVYMVRVAGARREVVDATPEEIAALSDEAALFEGPDRLARTLTVLDDAALEMRSAADTRLVLEIALTRLARPESDLTLEALADRLDRIEAQLAAGVPSAPLDAGAAAAMMGRAQTKTQPEPQENVQAKPPAMPQAKPQTMPQAKPPVAAPVKPAVAASAKPAAAPTKPVATAPAQPAPAPSASSAPSAPAAPAPSAPTAPTSAVAAEPVSSAPAAAADAGELQRRWAEVVRRVTAAQPSRGALLQSSRAKADDGDVLTVAFPAGSGFAIKMLGRADSEAAVNPVVASVFGPRKVVYVMGDAPSATVPAASSAPAAPAKPAAPAPEPAASAPVTAVPAPVPTAAAPEPTTEAPSSPAPTPEAPAVSPAPAPKTAPTPSQGAPAPSPAPAAQPSPKAAPAPRTTSPGFVPFAGADAPAPAPAADQTSGPTIVPEPTVDEDRQAWEDEAVPYDDAFIAGFEEDEDLPPFDMPAPEPATPAPSTPATAPATAPAAPAAPVTAPAAPASPVPSAPDAPAQSDFDARAVFNHAAPPAEVPETSEDAMKLLGDVFGTGVVIHQE